MALPPLMKLLMELFSKKTALLMELSNAKQSLYDSFHHRCIPATVMT
jgi:hypothetical protein